MQTRCLMQGRAQQVTIQPSIDAVVIYSIISVLEIQGQWARQSLPKFMKEAPNGLRCVASKVISIAPTINRSNLRLIPTISKQIHSQRPSFHPIPQPKFFNSLNTVYVLDLLIVNMSFTAELQELADKKYIKLNWISSCQQTNGVDMHTVYPTRKSFISIRGD